MESDEIRILLIGEGLDGSRIEGLPAATNGQMSCELTDDGLTCPGGGRDQYGGALNQGFAGTGLEGVESEPVGLLELGDLG